MTVQTDGQPPTTGQVAAAISDATVRLIASYTGRGPTRARTTISGRWVFIALEDTLTKGERRLAESGKHEWVLQTRKQFQEIMRVELEEIVTTETGRRVIAFMSDNHIDPDLGVEAFLLEPDGDPLGAAEAAAVD